MLLAAVALLGVSRAAVARAGRKCPDPRPRAEQPGGVAHRTFCHAGRTAERRAPPISISHAIRSCRAVNAAEFNRRMRKTARPVVWEGDGAQSPSLDPILLY